MVWWIIAAYLLIAAATFVHLVRKLIPLDIVAWLSVLILSLAWPAAVFFLL